VFKLILYQTEELEKARKHLNLLREQYVKLQEQYAELQRTHSALKASSNVTLLPEPSLESVSEDHSLASGLLKLTKRLHGSSLFR